MSDVKTVLRWVVINLLVGVLLAGVCYLAHRYMVRPSLSVTIWPAAGVGVGLIMVWGKRIIPAIAISELINSIVLFQTHVDFGWNRMALYDFLLYLTNVARPVFAGYLARYVVGKDPQLIHFKGIVKFFTYAAVIPCFLTTIIFVLLLSGAGHYTTDDYFTRGSLWYLEI